jgi:hypothetical protein
MEGNGQGAGNGYRGRDIKDFRGAGQSHIFARGGHSRPYPRCGYGGFSGNRGGGRQFEDRGRGFGPNRHYDNRHFEEPRPNPVPPTNGGDMLGTQVYQTLGQARVQGNQQDGTASAGERAPNNYKGNVDSTSLPTNILALFQKFLETIANKEEATNAAALEGSKLPGEAERVEKPAQTRDGVESSTQGEVRGNNAANVPYCYRCSKHGHPKEECTVTLFCDICENPNHIRRRCPILKKAKSTYALTCGYAVDGLGFYYVPRSVAVRPRARAKAAVV